MPNLPVPQRGQPIDFKYLYDVVESVNELSKDQASTSGITRISTRAGNEALPYKTSQVVMVAKYEVSPLIKVTSTNKSTSRSQIISFGSAFKFPPIVTVTAQHRSDSALASKGVIVNIAKVTKDSVEVSFSFTATGNAAIGFNVIAIGIPV
jgi:hypothetical protein